MKRFAFTIVLELACCLTSLAAAQARRRVIIDQDCSGPGGSNMQTVALLVQSPRLEVLGITVVSGNQWRDEEVQHALRLLEILGRPEIPVFRGAEFPLVRTHAEAERWQERYGKVAFAGAWDARWWHEAKVIAPLPEGAPKITAAEEDAAHFLVRMVRKYPHEVTIYEGGPMTDLAQAIALDPEFPALAAGLVFMGGSLSPQTQDPEFVNNPRHEFNFWFDPEAAQIVLRAAWKKIVCTPVDISIKTRLTDEMIRQIDAGGTSLGRYVARYFRSGQGGEYMWDELAALAWVEPALITRSEVRWMSVDIGHGAEYGNTLTWNAKDKPMVEVRPVEIQVDLDNARFDGMVVQLLGGSGK